MLTFSLSGSGCVVADPCCQTDDQCAVGAMCFEGNCTLRCDDDSQCDDGSHCSHQVCVLSNRQQSQCPFSSDRQIVAPSPPPIGLSDDGGVPPPVTCPDEDNLEENDTPQQATEGFPLSTPISLFLCPQDDDFYRIDLNAGETLHAQINFRNSDGDLDLEITDIEGAVLARSQGLDDVERLEYDVFVGGTAFVHVVGFAGAGGSYEMVLEVAGRSEQCEDDVFEDNDTDDSAFPIVPGAYNATLCPNDPDRYTIQTSAGEQISVRIQYQAPPAMRLTLSRPSTGATVSSDDGVGLEAIEIESGTEGTLIVQIDGDSGGAGQSYSLEYSSSANPPGLPPPLCGDDLLEPNDSSSSASVVGGPGSVEAQICSSDVDFFHFLLPQPPIDLTPHTGTLSLLADDQSIVAKVFSWPDQILLADATAGLPSPSFVFDPQNGVVVMVRSSTLSSSIYSVVIETQVSAAP